MDPSKRKRHNMTMGGINKRKSRLYNDTVYHSNLQLKNGNYELIFAICLGLWYIGG